MTRTILTLVFPFLLISCSNQEKKDEQPSMEVEVNNENGFSQNSTEDYYIVDNEYEMDICDSMEIDSMLIYDIRKYSRGKIEPFHYSLSKMYENGKAFELDPIRLNGLVIYEKNADSYDLVFELKDDFRKRGYSIFLLENNFDIDGDPDMLGILNTPDKFSVLRQIRTDAINYDIDNDSLISIIKELDVKYDLELIGASGDWCEFIIHEKPSDWMKMAEEIYVICPDVVDQGAGSIEALAETLETTESLYLWWD